MSVKARWSTRDVALPRDDSDPFADDTPIEQAVHVPTAGLPIDVNAPLASLQERLRSNLNEQSNLYNAGIDCPIRWRDEACCNACPISRHAQATNEGRLCLLSREQEQITTLMAVRAVDGG